MARTARIHTRAEPNLVAALRAEATARGVSVGTVVRESCAAHVALNMTKPGLSAGPVEPLGAGEGRNGA